jgi:hypothetical protein
MNVNGKYCKVCDGCLCEMLNDPEIKISPNVFHNNICSFHYKYYKTNTKEKELYETTGRNFFVDLIEYNIIKQKIRDVTMIFLIKFLNEYFVNT